MPSSKRWKLLKREIEALRRHLLPTPFDPTGNYRQRFKIHARTRGFLILCHAEVESYLEGWAKELARASEIAWTKGKLTKTHLFMLATQSERILVPESFAPKGRDSVQLLDVIFKGLFQAYYDALKENNGIKEYNVLAMFVPLGLPATALGTTLLPNLQSLGKRRGDHAHQSATAVQAMLDPESEYKGIQTLLNDLLTLDSWLVDSKRRIR